MVFQRLHSFRRQKAKKEKDASIGETLKSDEQFSIEIPHIMSDKATKDSVFLGTGNRNRSHGDGSMSSISSVTTNSGSSRTLRSRQTAEARRKDIRATKDKQEPSTTNSIAATVCTGTFTNKDDHHDGATKNSGDREDRGLATIMNFLPTCCSPTNDVTVTRVDTDDRSDIALNVLDDDDTIEPVYDSRDIARTSRKKRNSNDKNYGKKENKKFLGFLRRVRTNAKS